MFGKSWLVLRAGETERGGRDGVTRMLFSATYVSLLEMFEKQVSCIREKQLLNTAFYFIHPT